MASGSCLCGKVTYTIDGEISDIVHCHCHKCRKAHASAFSSVASVKQENFHLMGNNILASFESSPGKHRYFCSNCGSQIYSQRTNKNRIIIRLGCIDTEISSQEYAHTWISQKAAWYTIGNSPPQYEHGLED